jgi:hypothetical protein
MRAPHGGAQRLDSAASAAGYFDGAIDEARIWKYARSLSEIQGALARPRRLPDPSLRRAMGDRGVVRQYGVQHRGAGSRRSQRRRCRNALGSRPCGGPGSRRWRSSRHPRGLVRARGARIRLAARRASSSRCRARRRSSSRFTTCSAARGDGARTAHSEGGDSPVAWRRRHRTAAEPAPNGMYYARFRSGADGHHQDLRDPALSARRLKKATLPGAGSLRGRRSACNFAEQRPGRGIGQWLHGRLASARAFATPTHLRFPGIL